MEMGEKIKLHRELLHMTLEELGNKVGVGKSTVRKWENGMIANMRRDKIAKIASALNVSPAYLMGWVDNPDPAYLETKTGKLEMLISKDAQDAEAEIQRQVNRGLAQAGLNMDEVTKAMDLFHQYEKASPEIQSAIETLLKAAQSES